MAPPQRRISSRTKRKPAIFSAEGYVGVKNESTTKKRKRVKKAAAPKNTKQAKASSGSKVKDNIKNKTGLPATNTNKICLFDNVDIASHIVDYLDIKSMFRLSLCSKAIMKDNIISYEQVIRAAFFAHNKGQIADPDVDDNYDLDDMSYIQWIIHLIRKDSIYVPSVKRLLCLFATGKGCEICGKYKKRDVRSWENGVAMCHGCMTKNIGYRRSKLPCLRHPRMAGRNCATMILLLAKPYYYKTITGDGDDGGEWAGSILTFQDIDGRHTRNPPTLEETLRVRDKKRNKYKQYRQTILDAAAKCRKYRRRRR